MTLSSHERQTIVIGKNLFHMTPEKELTLMIIKCEKKTSHSLMVYIQCYNFVYQWHTMKNPLFH